MTQITSQLQRQHCQAQLHVHLFHALLLTYSHPAGLGLIKPCWESHTLIWRVVVPSCYQTAEIGLITG